MESNKVGAEKMESKLSGRSAMRKRTLHSPSVGSNQRFHGQSVRTNGEQLPGPSHSLMQKHPESSSTVTSGSSSEMMVMNGMDVMSGPPRISFYLEPLKARSSGLGCLSLGQKHQVLCFHKAEAAHIFFMTFRAPVIYSD